MKLKDAVLPEDIFRTIEDRSISPPKSCLSLLLNNTNLSFLKLSLLVNDKTLSDLLLIPLIDSVFLLLDNVNFNFLRFETLVTFVTPKSCTLSEPPLSVIVATLPLVALI